LNFFSRHPGQPDQAGINPHAVPSNQPDQAVVNPPAAPAESAQAPVPPPAPLAAPATLDGLMLLFDKAANATNTNDSVRAYRAFLQQGADFAVAHPEQTNLWVKRAKAALAVDYADAGWVAGKQLTALNLIHSEAPEARKVMADLERKGWLGPKRPQHDWRAVKGDQIVAAANDGDEEAQVMLGNCFFAGQSGLIQDFAVAAQWYRKAAEQGDSAGQEALGSLYEYGRGVPQDYAEALKWIRKAADQGVAEAQNNLGILYLYGSGTQQNYTEALKWFRKAVEQRNAAAEGNLGVMYENGWGLATNVTEAISCYRKAAVLGNSSAEQSIQRLTKSGPKAAPQ
jgi:TPR repeat protein